MSRPLVHRAPSDDRLIPHPDALHERASPLHLSAMEPLRTVTEKGLATVFEAPASFDITCLHVRAAALAGMKGNLFTVRFVLGKRDRLHVDASGGIFIYLRVCNG